MRASVALVKGNERYENIQRALSLMAKEIEPKGKVLIKPNFVSTSVPACATHCDAVRAVISFLEKLGVEKFIIGEGAADGATAAGFKNYGYYGLAKEHDVEFVDLNKDSWVKVRVFDSRLQRSIDVRVARTVLNSYRISVTRPKTHDTTIVTLSLKNLLVGSLVGEDKGLIHQGYGAINFTLALLAKLIPPHLAVIDGFIGMEGNGPVYGTTIAPRWAIASTNGLAADMVATELMGFDFKNVGYLFYCSKLGLGPRSLDEIDVLGSRIDECKMPFTPHFTYKEQLKWGVENWKKVLYEIKSSAL